MSTARPFCFVCGKVKSVGVFQLIEGKFKKTQLKSSKIYANHFRLHRPGHI